MEEIRTAFKLFDVKGKGYITVDDLKQITKELKEDIKSEELEVNLVISSVIFRGICGHHEENIALLILYLPLYLF